MLKLENVIGLRKGKALGYRPFEREQNRPCQAGVDCPDFSGGDLYTAISMLLIERSLKNVKTIFYLFVYRIFR